MSKDQAARSSRANQRMQRSGSWLTALLSATEGDLRHRDIAPAQSLEPNPQPLSPWDPDSYGRTEVEPSYFVENGPLDRALKFGPLLLGHIEPIQMDKETGACV